MERDAHQKLKMKSHAESKTSIRDSDIRVGDTVLVKQPKLGKLSTPYHPVPCSCHILCDIQTMYFYVMKA